MFFFFVLYKFIAYYKSLLFLIFDYCASTLMTTALVGTAVLNLAFMIDHLCIDFLWLKVLVRIRIFLLDQPNVIATWSLKEFSNHAVVALSNSGLQNGCLFGKNGQLNNFVLISFVFYHTTGNVLVLVRPPTSISVGRRHCLARWPPGNSPCCRLFLNNDGCLAFQRRFPNDSR